MDFFRKELIYVSILLLGSMSWGLTMAYWSPCKISMTDSLEYSDIIGTLFNFLAPLACIFGGPFINIFIDKLGRNKSIFITSLFMFLSWVAMSYTKSNFYYLALITRFFLGFAVGSFSTIIPMYIIELSPNDVIGAYRALHQFGISIGILLCYIMGIWLKWRKITLLSSIPAGLLSILIWLVPESKIDSAQKSNENTVKESVFQQIYIKQILISAAFMFFQQFAGTNAFLANLNDIFSKSRIDIKSSAASVIVGLIGSASVLLISVIIGLCGRKLVWYISSLGQAVVLALCACNAKWNWSPIIPIICLILDNLLFSIGVAPIPWFVLPELFNESVRSSATSFITATNWLFGSVLFFLWDVMASAIGLSWSFSIFAVIMVFGFIFGIFVFSNQSGIEDTQADMDNANSSKLLDQVLI